ncbi:MAG TPA: PAS domain-containing sensor histidine kinase [Paraburkholderia sp.]|uniref:PAS domain-containing sensor histidine kinase n=1 Tax=Paraburkholderia sp. TaxID=1926495 RepID=UPI002B490503|nr:PAS domain-containing sensor histidine kinase [Paraburkholderia sp.]HKR40736.1 PAS domain-containing sensor histidine kinase [Paraburkholderia sp.]
MKASPDTRADGATPEAGATGEVPYKALVEQSLVGIYVIQDDALKYANAAFAQMTGFRPDEIVGRPLKDLVSPEAVEDVQRKAAERLLHGSSIRYTTRGRHKDGRDIDLEVHGSAVEFDGHAAVAGVAIDISQRMRYEQELNASREELRELTTHLNSVREQHRAKTAREVHDVLGGILTAIKMDASRILERAHGDDVAEITRNLIASAQEGIEVVREVSESLYPAALDHLGLEAAIRHHLERFCARHSLAAVTRANGVLSPLSPEQKLAAYRIFQEALTNIARHAHARHVRVRIDVNSATFTLAVEDDGVGLNSSEPRRGAMGLISMRERAREVGGTLSIGKCTPRGTCVTLTLPLASEGPSL